MNLENNLSKLHLSFLLLVIKQNKFPLVPSIRLIPPNMCKGGTNGIHTLFRQLYFFGHLYLNIKQSCVNALLQYVPGI